MSREQRGAAAGAAMSVRTDLQDAVAVVCFQHGPVNALSGALRRQIAKAVADAHSNPEVRAVVLYGDSARGFFSSGADISEFAGLHQQPGSVALANAALDPDEYAIFESGPKPVVAAVDGVCFGGGLELAMSCAARVSSAKSSFALPELKLGIIPGLGGTQRLPRLVGFQHAMRMMLFSETVPAAVAVKLGLVDELLAPDSSVEQLLSRAAAFARELAAQTRPRFQSLIRTDRLESVNACEKMAREIQNSAAFMRASANNQMPQFAECLRVALVGVRDGSVAGLRAEQQAFAALVVSPTCKALVHLFFAQRNATAPAGAAAADGSAGIRKAAVIGGGLMGAGIATVLLKAGVAVVIKEVNAQASAAARARVASNLQNASDKEREACLARLGVREDWNGFSEMDIVVEAALEDIALKQSVFQTLSEVTPAHCILATNTSTINIDLVAAKIPSAHYRDGRVVGLHFFSPAHVMPLVEIVTTQSTRPEVVATCAGLAKRMKKTPVVVGNCAGFAVNRMYFPQGQAASLLVSTFGVSPYRVDEAMQRFGLPMGAFRLLDLVGLDIGVAVNSVYDMAYAERSYNRDGGLLKDMVGAGRKGQKTGAGFYRYEKGNRQSIEDEAALAPFLAKARANAASAQAAQPLTDQQIVDMILLPCVNEGTRIIEEKVVHSAADLDVCSVFGMGFPSFRGGLMHWAQHYCGGPVGVLQKLRDMHVASGGVGIYTPSHALVRAVLIGHPVIDRLPRPQRERGGNPDDIVVVSAFRTAVGRAHRGGLKDTPIDDMVSPLVARIMDEVRGAVEPRHVDDVVLGLVLPRGDSGVVMLRVGGFLAGLPETTPVRTVNRLCSSGLQAIADAAAGIRSGHYKIVLAGGAENMSSVPFTNKELKFNPKVKAHKLAQESYLSMGETSENVAARFAISRERQDRLAVVSHARAAAASLSGKLSTEIVPVDATVIIPPPNSDKAGANGALDDKTASEKVATVAPVQRKKVRVDRDEGVRFGVTAASLAKLKPVFRKEGSTTAGNASQLSDGAAMMMMMKRSEAKRRGLRPRATFRAFAVAGVEPGVMGIGPAVAIPAVLEKAGLTANDIDIFEINEAFGSQAEYCIDILGLNRDVVNVNGGAIAIGHPLGMTGARLSVSIINELERRGGRYGVVSMCIGTGMGAAAVYEITDDEPAAKL